MFRLLVLFLMVIAIPSCSLDFSNEDALIVLLIDVSDSTKPVILPKKNGLKTRVPNPNRENKIPDVHPRGVRGEYLNVIKSIFEKVKYDVVVRGTSFSDRALRITEFPIREEIPYDSIFFSNEYTLKEEKQAVVNRIVEAATQVLADKRVPIKNTCIIDTLALAADSFERIPKKNRYLFIFTDAQEDCGSVNFWSKDPPITDSEREKLISQIAEEGRLPNLRNVKVYVYGSSDGKESTGDSQHYNAVKKFWQAFFMRSNAELVQYGAPFEFSPQKDQGVN